MNQRLIVFVLALGLAAPTLTAAAEALAPAASAAPVPRLVGETTAELTAAGCEAVPRENDQRLAAAYALGWQAVVPSDASGGAVIFCPKETAVKLRIDRPGRVAAFEGYVPLNVPTEGRMEAVQKIWALPDPVKSISSVLGTVFAPLFKMIALVGEAIFNFGINMVPELLTIKPFVTNKTVQQVWPIVLGITNLGFMLALVLIGLFTALRLDIGGGVRRLLPRLLLAALLVNFSLVIAGLIVDASRVVMAATIIIFPNEGGLSKLTDNLAIKGQIPVVLTAVKAFFPDGAGQGATEFLHMLVAWVAALAIMVVAFLLIVRYIVIVLLLITSPLAYLFLALPAAGQWARRWWTTFLRYVILGPVILVLLLGAISVQQLDLSGFFPSGADIAKAEAIGILLKFLVMTSAIVLAALAGRQAGILGAAMAINVATRTGRRARGLAYRGTGLYAKGLGKGAYVGSGARRAVRYGRDYARERLKPVRKALKLGEYSAYDKAGKRKKGRVTPGEEAGILKRSQTARAARAAAAGALPGDIPTHPDLAPEKLTSADVYKTLRREDIDRHRKHGSAAREQAVVDRADGVRQMRDESIKQGLADAGLRPSLERALREIDRQDNP